MNVQPFTPGTGATYNLVLSATSTSSSVTLPAAAQVIRVVNSGTANIAFRMGIGAQTAVFASDTVMLAGTVEVFSKGQNDTFAAITASSTATVYVSVGEGQ